MYDARSDDYAHAVCGLTISPTTIEATAGQQRGAFFGRRTPVATRAPYRDGRSYKPLVLWRSLLEAVYLIRAI